MDRSLQLQCVAGAVLALALTFWSAARVSADGNLPAQPYRYLHPPAALAKNNQTPLPGQYVVPADYLRSSGFDMFTLDGQAGLSGQAKSFHPPKGATAVTLRVRPVEAPSGLPAQVALDGNAYNVTATEQPGSSLLAPARPVNIILRWPHLPIAVYTYQKGGWRQLCYSNKALLTTTTISCPSTTLGIFAAVTTPSNIGSTGSAPRSSSLSRYILLIAALVVVVLAAIGAYFVTRTARSEST
jgi:hypothetical protein